jgi:hypothetical protein
MNRRTDVPEKYISKVIDGEYSYLERENSYTYYDQWNG